MQVRDDPLPGEGAAFLTYSSLEEARDGTAELNGTYDAHRRVEREFAEAVFSSYRVVLPRVARDGRGVKKAAPPGGCLTSALGSGLITSS